ncbi:type II toxin-antitoxin system VapC family toxin [Mucilaginibacter terrae]|uniref:type II toxin-antitoxin system VapC family toxin n=1 Tax=Mucilaginibacter terrae TaxID=1955052 RepID=UPI0036357057
MISGDNIVIDTLLVINLFNGIEQILPLITSRNLYVSVISEIEVLSFPNLTKHDKSLLKDFSGNCYLINLDSPINDITINIRAKYKTKLPDAVIAATAIYYDIPLFTMDKGFKEIDDPKSVVLSY